MCEAVLKDIYTPFCGDWYAFHTHLASRNNGLPLGLLLIALPWLGGFSTGGPEMWIPIVAGVGMLGLSAFTAYEAGVVKAIPMSGHLTVDALTGGFLAASPWLFGFAELVYLPHVILGLGAIGGALTTQLRPGHRLARTPMKPTD
jgi:hypothetical protein